MQVVIFTTNSARLFQNPPNANEFLKWPNAVFDPDLSRVHAIPPQFWKLIDGQIYPMNGIEMRVRKRVIERSGIDNMIRKLSPDDFRLEAKEIQIVEALIKDDKKRQTINIVLTAINLALLIVMILRK